MSARCPEDVISIYRSLLLCSTRSLRRTITTSTSRLYCMQHTLLGMQLINHEQICRVCIWTTQGLWTLSPAVPQVGPPMLWLNGLDLFCCCSSCKFCLGQHAGGTTAVFVSPLEVLKTRLQTQARGSAKYLGGIHIYGMLPCFGIGSCTSTKTMFAHIVFYVKHCCSYLIPELQHQSCCNSGGLKQIVAEEGPRGLYRGLGPQFVALLPNWAVRCLLLLGPCPAAITNHRQQPFVFISRCLCV